ncbi:hypothetical protein DVH24_004669 [Malus domestica]|uniref:Uncharacterized protein n=1 Tax=Malus domestica TaxID=3750 RepID=A0A498IF56_MALDO|nr:hypothetical protein DVH24_004669 [Malus domestica]
MPFTGRAETQPITTVTTNDTTHLAIILDDILENLGPRTTLAQFSPLRQHHRIRNHHHPITVVENTATSHHPSKI